MAFVCVMKLVSRNVDIEMPVCIASDSEVKTLFGWTSEQKSYALFFSCWLDVITIWYLFHGVDEKVENVEWGIKKINFYFLIINWTIIYYAIRSFIDEVV